MKVGGIEPLVPAGLPPVDSKPKTVSKLLYFAVPIIILFSFMFYFFDVMCGTIPAALYAAARAPVLKKKSSLLTK